MIFSNFELIVENSNKLLVLFISWHYYPSLWSLLHVTLAVWRLEAKPIPSYLHWGLCSSLWARFRHGVCVVLLFLLLILLLATCAHVNKLTNESRSWRCLPLRFVVGLYMFYFSRLAFFFFFFFRALSSGANGVVYMKCGGRTDDDEEEEELRRRAATPQHCTGDSSR